MTAFEQVPKSHVGRPGTGVETHRTEDSGVFRIGGDLPVNRLGFGTMRLTGPGVWGGARQP